MRLGVISDTHGLLRPEVFDVFSGVDHILHAGDVGPAALLAELEAIAPVTAVYGNTDGRELRDRLPQVAAIELDGFNIVVTHGDQFGSPTPEQLHDAFPDAEILIFGHTHRPLLTLVDVVVTVDEPGRGGCAAVQSASLGGNSGAGARDTAAGEAGAADRRWTRSEPRDQGTGSQFPVPCPQNPNLSPALTAQLCVVFVVRSIPVASRASNFPM